MNYPITWKGKGLNERGYNINNKCIIEIKKKYFRPTEVDNLLGNYSKARRVLKWKPKHNIKSLIKEMIDYEINFIKDDLKKF